MRLVTWNCNGAFRRKVGPIDALDADVLVIQECEDPSQSTPDYRSWAGDYAWIGYGKNNGIGIFPRKGQSIEQLAWPSNLWELFLPVRIDDSFTVLGVWTQHAAPSRFAYIGQFGARRLWILLTFDLSLKFDDAPTGQDVAIDRLELQEAAELRA